MLGYNDETTLKSMGQTDSQNQAINSNQNRTQIPVPF